MRLLIVSCLGASPSIAAGQALTERMDRYLTELHLGGQLTGSVGVSERGEVLLAKGYGFADAEHEVSNTPQTRFRIGSMTKQFTAMAILILQEQGKLKVSDTLGMHLSGIPRTWEGLTIHQLLTHTSGLMHSWKLPGFEATMMVPASLDDVLKRFYEQPLVFKPGEGFEYSGLGYFVLAKVIEVTSHQPYGEFLQDAIFAPLGMRSTGADRPEVVLAGRARGYVREDGVLRNAPSLYVPILTGGGNLYSTVEDLLRWDRALRDGRLLSPAGYEALYRPEREDYAYGWAAHEVDGRQVLEHTGGVPGFHSIIYRLPKEQLCIVVLSNVEPGDSPKIARHLAEMVLQRR